MGVQLTGDGSGMMMLRAVSGRSACGDSEYDDDAVYSCNEVKGCKGF